MVVCNKCGNENPLGRVFCVKCGSKLDLSRMTSQHVAEIQKSWSDPLVKYWPKVMAAIVILAVILVALACWPTAGVIGKPGTLVDGHKVENGLSSLKFIRAGDTRNLVFKEEEVNGYFQFCKTKTMNMQSVSVVILEGRCYVRLIQPIQSFSIPLINRTVEPVVSYDLICQPYGGALMLETVTVGHLSMFGPLKDLAARRVLAMFERQPEWETLKSVSDIKCEAGQISLQAKK